ncbi:MAG: hypothetical protein CM15mP102_06090 [Flavobacteriales bacterium]|nr:MAG: hypothetical protein CM15mP102_06090 [Flavobacteriales bacterium]
MSILLYQNQFFLLDKTDIREDHGASYTSHIPGTTATNVNNNKNNLKLDSIPLNKSIGSHHWKLSR